jgi:hypothetical protein
MKNGCKCPGNYEDCLEEQAAFAAALVTAVCNALGLDPNETPEDRARAALATLADPARHIRPVS